MIIILWMLRSCLQDSPRTPNEDSHIIRFPHANKTIWKQRLNRKNWVAKSRDWVFLSPHEPICDLCSDIIYPAVSDHQPFNLAKSLMFGRLDISKTLMISAQGQVPAMLDVSGEEIHLLFASKFGSSQKLQQRTNPTAGSSLVKLQLFHPLQMKRTPESSGGTAFRSTRKSGSYRKAKAGKKDFKPIQVSDGKPSRRQDKLISRWKNDHTQVWRSFVLLWGTASKRHNTGQNSWKHKLLPGCFS